MEWEHDGTPNWSAATSVFIVEEVVTDAPPLACVGVVVIKGYVGEDGLYLKVVGGAAEAGQQLGQLRRNCLHRQVLVGVDGELHPRLVVQQSGVRLRVLRR